MSNIHSGIAFSVTLALAVTLGVVILAVGPDSIVDVHGFDAKAVVLFLFITLGFGAFFWFGPCRSASNDRRLYCWFVAITNIAVFGVLAAAVTLRMVAR